MQPKAPRAALAIASPQRGNARPRRTKQKPRLRNEAICKKKQALAVDPSGRFYNELRGEDKRRLITPGSNQIYFRCPLASLPKTVRKKWDHRKTIRAHAPSEITRRAPSYLKFKGEARAPPKFSLGGGQTRRNTEEEGGRGSHSKRGLERGLGGSGGGQGPLAYPLPAPTTTAEDTRTTQVIFFVCTESYTSRKKTRK